MKSLSKYFSPRNLHIAYDLITNRLLSSRYDLFYVVENADWSIAWDGKYITQSLNQAKLINSKTVVDPFGIKNSLLHFGSENTLLTKKGPKKFHPSNKAVLTWFHISPQDKRTKFIPRLNSQINCVHTSCQITKNKLIQFGLNPEKIIVIPLGVDLNQFRPRSSQQTKKIKQRLGLPQNKIIIGSFQKDGNGWKEGNTPKLVKGPDIFCDVVEKLAKQFPIHILLTGPARGYVKNRLKKAGISFTHRYLKNYPEIARYYPVLDLYLVTSREEGGPKAILESLACGVPVVSTKVGLAPDIIKDGENALLAGIEDRDELIEKSSLVLKNKEMKEKIIKNGLKTIKKFSWDIIAQRYYREIYLPLLKK